MRSAIPATAANRPAAGDLLDMGSPREVIERKAGKKELDKSQGEDQGQEGRNDGFTQELADQAGPVGPGHLTDARPP